MAKKTLKKKKMTKAAPKKGISQLADPVVDSAQNIWRAGLGALAMAQQEGGKVVGQGSAMFEKLVAEGSRIEAEGRKAVDQGTSAMRSKVTNTRDGVESTLNEARKQAEDRWDKLENVFEERVARVMARLGVPSGDELNRLSAQVEKLSGQVSALAKQPRTVAKVSAKKAPAKKAAEKKVTPPKAAAKKAAVKKAASKRKATSTKATVKNPAKTPASKKAAKAAKEPVVYHLLPKDDKWSVRLEGADKDSRVLDTKQAGLDAARKLAQSKEPSRLVVHRADGTIQTSYSYGDD